VIETHPVRIPGRWREGYALDIHTLSSTYLGDDEFGHARFETKRSPAGDLLYRLKYQSEQAAVGELATAAAGHVQVWKPEVELVVPVPPSRQRPFQPVMAIGRALAEALGPDFCDTCVRRTREVAALKDVFDYDERWRLLTGLHEIDKARVAGRKILLFDDLFRSGATMNSITAALYDSGGAADVFALTVTRTRSNQ
jgi:predicted amidophosphoribosyltransferase